MSAEWGFCFTVEGRATVYADSFAEAKERAEEALFSLNEIDLNEMDIDAVQVEIGGLA